MRRPFALTSLLFPALVTVLSCALVLGTTSSFAQSEGQRRRASRVANANRRLPDTVRMQYKGVQIQRVIREVGLATGTRFIFSDGVTGVVTITVPKPVSKPEALELLRAALFVKGFAQMPAGDDAYKVVPIAATPTDSAFVEGSLDSGSERAITTLLTLENADVGTVAETVKTLAPSSGAVIPYSPTNSLILSGTESALARLIDVIRVIDDAGGLDLMTRVIRYRDVDEMIQLAEPALNEGFPRASRIRFFSDQRTNMLMAQGPADRLEELRDFIADFDRYEVGRGRIQVVRVLNREPEEIVEMLLALRQGDAIVDRTTTAGSRRRAPATVDVSASSLAGQDFSLTVDVPTRSIIVQADPSVGQLVADVIGELDQLAPRVSVEIFYYEVQRPSGFLLSLDFTTLFSPKNSDDLAFNISHTPSGRGVPTGPQGEGAFGRFARDPITLDITDPTTGVSIPIVLPTNEAAVEASASQVRADLLNRPNIVGASGEEHEIFVGNNVPIPVSNGTGGQISSPTVEGEEQAVVNPLSTLSTQQTIERVDVGSMLRVKPIVSQGGQIQLELTFELSEVTESITGDAQAEGVTLLQRTIESTAILRPGEYVILGMQDQKSVRYAKTGVPWLMNLPLIGLFFSRTEERVVDTQILIAAKARLLRSPSDDVAETVRRRLAMERSISRVNDLERLSSRPWAVRLDTFEYKAQAAEVAEAFETDGFVTRVTRWEGSDRAYFDVYLIGYASFEDASAVGLQVVEADWEGEVLLVPDLNELGPDD